MRLFLKEKNFNQERLCFEKNHISMCCLLYRLGVIRQVAHMVPCWCLSTNRQTSTEGLTSTSTQTWGQVHQATVLCSQPRQEKLSATLLCPIWFKKSLRVLGAHSGQRQTEWVIPSPPL